jgi:hypothetical protein
MSDTTEYEWGDYRVNDEVIHDVQAVKVTTPKPSGYFSLTAGDYASIAQVEVTTTSQPRLVYDRVKSFGWMNPHRAAHEALCARVDRLAIQVVQVLARPVIAPLPERDLDRGGRKRRWWSFG